MLNGDAVNPFIEDCVKYNKGIFVLIKTSNKSSGDLQDLTLSNGMKVYVCNIMTKAGETDDFTVSDHIKVLQEHFGKEIIDFCICDSGEITPEFVKKYNLDGAEPVHIDYDKIKSQEVYFHLESGIIECASEYFSANKNIYLFIFITM